MSNSLQPHGLQHSRLPCSSLSPRVHSNSCPLSRGCHPTISSSTTLFSFCLQSFPASGSFPVSLLFESCGQSIGFSFSISPSNEYSGLISFKIDWFDLLAVQGTLKSLLQHPLDFLGWIIFKLLNLNLYWNVNEQSFTWWQRLTGISFLQAVNHGSSVGKWLMYHEQHYKD